MPDKAPLDRDVEKFWIDFEDVNFGLETTRKQHLICVRIMQGVDTTMRQRDLTYSTTLSDVI